MKKKLKWLGAGYLLAVIAAGLFFYFVGKENISREIESLKHAGLFGAALFMAVFIIGTLVFFPVTLLAFTSGVLYGATWGFLAAIVSSTFGACLAFLLSRYLCRDWIQKKISENEKFRSLREDVSKNGWKIVALSHLNFILPYTLLNYGFGLTQIPFLQYAFVTLIAMIPCTLLYAYLGGMAGTIAAYFQSHKNPSSLEIIFSGITLLVSIGLIMYLGKLAKKHLKKA